MRRGGGPTGCPRSPGGGTGCPGAGWAAAARGLDRDEAERALATFAEEFPEMDEPQLCAWLIEKWS